MAVSLRKTTLDSKSNRRKWKTNPLFFPRNSYQLKVYKVKETVEGYNCLKGNGIYRKYNREKVQFEDMNWAFTMFPLTEKLVCIYLKKWLNTPEMKLSTEKDWVCDRKVSINNHVARIQKWLWSEKGGEKNWKN